MLPALVALLSLAQASLAQTTTFHFDSAEELERAGFFHWSGGGSSTFEGGLMQVRSRGYEEWIHYRPEKGSFWFDHLSTARGWVIQVRLKLAPGSPKSTCADSGTGLWIHDGRRLLKFKVDAGAAGISYPFLRMVELDTEQFHTYRIEAQESVVRVRIDDRLVLEEGERTFWGGGTASLTLGSLGCTDAVSFWDEISFMIEPGPSPRGERAQ